GRTRDQAGDLWSHCGGEAVDAGCSRLGGDEPDARHARRATRRDQAGSVRDAGARVDGRRRHRRRRGLPADRRSDDPAHRHQGRTRLARSWVEGAIVEHSRQPKPAAKKGAKKVVRPKVTIGTMIETPRAALVANELAEYADFFSFGTNDLTQMTFGFSRDDVESRMMPAYLEAGLLKRNPFETIDQVGVGELVKIASARGRKAKRGIKLGVCGEHGGDPESIGLFYRAGLDYVSCSPYRIPIARLAAAQAIIGGNNSETK
ncbi:MAG: hypothetical protein EBQ75_00395, partial [Actinobacteria bacterium]|nr:hypothetical protein [Actinomycetota bacterium]